MYRYAPKYSAYDTGTFYRVCTCSFLDSTKAAVSVSYLKVRMFHDLNLSSFLRGYEHSRMSKTSFMISGASFILTLNILTGNFCKITAMSFEGTVFLQEVYQALNYGFHIQFLRLLHECDLFGYLVSDCEISKQLEHKEIEML